MPVINFRQGENNPGIITNLPSDSISWATGRNVSFRPGAVSKDFGKILLATVTDNLPVREVFTFKGYDNVWRSIVCCDSKIYSYTNNYANTQDITPASPPTSGATDVWTFALIGGMPVISNGVDTPWRWPNFASAMTTLTGAPVCKALHSHRNMLIMGDISEGGYDFPARLRWSDIVEPTDFGKDLKVSSGSADCLGNSASMEAIDRIQAITDSYRGMVVLCERNIYIGNQVEWPAVYSISAMNNGIGLIARRAFAKTPDGAIYFMGQDDFFRIGESVEPIGFPIRNAVFPLLNKAKIQTAFAYFKPSAKEVCFAYPTGANTTPDTVACYNTETKGWSFKDCDYTAHSFNFDSSNTTWDTITDTQWDNIDSPSWDEFDTTGILPYEVVGNSTGKILKMDDGYNNNGVAIEGFIETGDISYIDEKTGIRYNVIVNEVIPLCKPQDSITAIMVAVGTRENLHKDIEWSQPQAFTIGVSRHVNFRKMGKYARLRFYTDVDSSPWILEGFSAKFSIGGSR